MTAEELEADTEGMPIEQRYVWVKEHIRLMFRENIESNDYAEIEVFITSPAFDRMAMYMAPYVSTLVFAPKHHR